MPISTYTDGVGDALRSIGDYASGLVTPTVRLGVTGLARSGKTVFITALVHNLIAGARLPFFDASAEGRLLARLSRAAARRRRAAIRVRDRISPISPARRRAGPRARGASASFASRSNIETRKFWKRQLGRDRLHIDIVDYPGEWLLDLPLLRIDYREWSRAALEQAGAPDRKKASKEWRKALGEIDPAGAADEALAAKLSNLFKTYLSEARSDQYSLSTLPPGRFLMPGELAGSPALTFAPLDPGEETSFARGSLWSMMERRFEAYKTHVVRPFFRDHFARLDRQIVLIDVLAALNDGAEAVADLERAMTEILECFRTGANSLWSSPVRAAHRSHRARRHQGRPSCITKATTGSRRSSPSSQGGRWRAPNLPAPK